MMSRVREALFSMLASSGVLRDSAAALDLFAGSGAVLARRARTALAATLRLVQVAFRGARGCTRIECNYHFDCTNSAVPVY